jgi:hypothetical protein
MAARTEDTSMGAYTMKTKKTKIKKNIKKKKVKLSKAQRIAERKAKQKAKKGDGSFPDIIVLTKEENAAGNKYFAAHAPDLGTLYEDGTEVAVYKLRRVSTVSIKRKITLVRK